MQQPEFVSVLGGAVQMVWAMGGLGAQWTILGFLGARCRLSALDTHFGHSAVLFNAQNVWAVFRSVVAEVWALSGAPEVPICVFLFGRSVQAQGIYPSFWGAR